MSYYAFFAPALWLLQQAPWLGVVALVRGVLEPLAHLATRRASLANLERVYGTALEPRERRRLARAVTHNFVTALLEVLTALRRGTDAFAARIDDRDAEALLERMEREVDTGFIALTGHLGNWELLGHWLGRRSKRGLGAVVAHRMPNQRLNAAIERIRARLGMETFYPDDPPTRALRHLRSGRPIGIVPDQDVKNLGGMFIDFLGHQAFTPAGPARLALTAKVPIVCGFLVRDGHGGYRIEASEPIHPDPDAPRAAEIERLTRAWSAEVEKAIRAHPEQWAWFHARWRTTVEKLESRGRGALR
ncbi:MAG: hypothetical protein IPM29_25230 [Planctomycetes bacterium]|nr:hypothetical protein [Planctomycetota bacterium]